jgi:hypothetical protein
LSSTCSTNCFALSAKALGTSLGFGGTASMAAPAIEEIITEEELVILAQHIATKQLSFEQKESVMEAFLATSSQAERIMIAKLYTRLFSEQAFMQRLLQRIDAHQSNAAEGGETLSSSTQGPGPRGRAAGVTEPGGASRKRDSGREHGSMSVRKAIAELPCLTGPGPFSIEMMRVLDETTNTKIVHLYASQFFHPDLHETQRIVTPPRMQSNRSRQRKVQSGVFSFYLFCHVTGEIAASITAIIHNEMTLRVVEVPLCAVASGYKRLGFGRLLGAALQALACEKLEAEVMVVSADPEAIPFWEKCGFTTMSRQWNSRLGLYLNGFHKFLGSTYMTWECKSPSAPVMPERLIQEALGKMPNFMLAGGNRLPWFF